MKKPTKTQSAYYEKLKDPRWQKLRLRIFERDNWTCCYCLSTTKNLQAHHLYYLPNTNPWDYPEYDLWTLCEECHADNLDHVINISRFLHLLRLAKWNSKDYDKLFQIIASIGRVSDMERSLKLDAIGALV